MGPAGQRDLQTRLPPGQAPSRAPTRGRPGTPPLRPPLSSLGTLRLQPPSLGTLGGAGVGADREGCVPRLHRACRVAVGSASWKMATAPSSPSREVGLPQRVSWVPARVELMLPSWGGAPSPDPQPSPAVAGTDCERVREG